jgi:anaerobic selenocysteine-containing dehydrogenase
MTDPSLSPVSKPGVQVYEPEATTVFEPYESPAGGSGALRATAEALREQSVVLKGSKALLSMNQPDGFDCPGCAWPDPKHTSSFEFCENGAKAVAFELTKRKVTRDFRGLHRQRCGTAKRLLTGGTRAPNGTEALQQRDRPLRADQLGGRFAMIGTQLRALESPDRADFYTSGRTSNEAAFLYRLFVRRFGTNNFPDCSNMCHEATSGPARKHWHRQRHGSPGRFR